MSWTPVIRRVSWLAAVPHIAVVAAVLYLAPNSPGMLILVMGAYLAYTYGMRSLIARDHRRGIWLVRNRDFERAIPAFEQSYDFFTRHPWLDRFRALTMLSASALSYREMALCNSAFCYTQIGNGEKAKEIYRQVLAEHPENGLASGGLRMLESVAKPQQAEPVGVGND